MIIEVKRRIGDGTTPHDSHLDQIDGYLDAARDSGEPERLGILSDGRHWSVRPISETGGPFVALSIRTFTLRTEQDAGDWRRWLRDSIEAFPEDRRKPTPVAVRHSFGASLAAGSDIGELRRLYDANSGLRRSRSSAACGRISWARRSERW